MTILRLLTIAAMSLCCVGITAGTRQTETLESFQVFLEQSLARQPAGTTDVDAFYTHAWTFWNDHLQDFEEHPDRYGSLLSLYYTNQAHYRVKEVVNSDIFRPEIEKFRAIDARNTLPPHPILFVGSSSIVRWETALAFPSYPIVNRGFGGSTLADVNYFYEDVVKKYHPAVIVMYCDNDLYRGDTPEVALQRFEAFATRVAHDLPQTPLLFLSIKPTPTDAFYGEHLRDDTDSANRLIKAFIAKQKNMRFVDVTGVMFQNGKLQTDIFVDGMHLNAKGYALWNPIVGKQLAEVYPPSGEDASGPQRVQYLPEREDLRHCLDIFVCPAGEPETFESFRLFLQQSLERLTTTEPADVWAFYKRAFTFWNYHVQDFEEHPERYRPLLSLYYKYQAHYPLSFGRTNIDRYRPAIEKFKELDARNTVPAKPILFVGSSSIVHWKTAPAFSSYPIINRGFGGSAMADINYFYDDVVKKYAPAVIVMYCDHDVYDYQGDTAEVALRGFEEFATRVSHDLPQTPLLFISIKPTPFDALWGEHVRENATRANRLIKDFITKQKNMQFVDVASAMIQNGKIRTDLFQANASTHMNAKGYALWNAIVAKQLATIYHPSVGDAESQPGPQRTQ